MAMLCVCLDLRISECLGLRWSDVDWLGATLNIERGIVEQTVDDVKTDSSRKALTIAAELLEPLKTWKQSSPFPSESDWIFASPLKLGRLPYLNARDCKIGGVQVTQPGEPDRMWHSRLLLRIQFRFHRNI